MNQNLLRSIFWSLVSLSFLTTFVSGQDDKLNQELAKRIVRSASVKPGDVVIINGGQHMIPLMEAIAIETQMMGAQQIIWLQTDKVTRSLNFDVPEKFLEIEPREFGEIYKHVNVLINLPTEEDSKAVYAGVPEARLAKMAKASDFFAGILNSLPIRLVGVNFPSKEDAELVGLDFPTYQKMIMNGVNADYEAISARALRLRQLFQNAKQVRVTTAAGTDFSFSIAPGRPFFIDDGIVTAEEARSKLFIDRSASLPGGQILFAPLESSVDGKVAIPKKMCHFEPMINSSFYLQNGVIRNFKADKNASCFEDTMKPYTGAKDVFSTISIGLNPAIKVMENGNENYRTNIAEGIVTISFGDNRVIGGNNASTGSFGFSITNATVSVDGKIIVKDGKMVF